MFIKLVKYEWIAMIRKMVPIYIAVIAVAALNYFLYRDILWTDLPLEDTLFGAIQALSAFVYFGLMVGLVAITILLVVQRFYNGLLKEEGYLMFTLPVRSWALALSKALVSILICILSFFVAVISICILGGVDFIDAFLSIPGSLVFLNQELSQAPELVPHAVIFFLELLLMALIWMFTWVYHFYLSMSLGQLFRNNRVVWSILWYVGISVVQWIASWFALSILATGFTDVPEIFTDTLAAAHAVMILILLAQGLWLAAEMLPTHYILDKRLNLE